MEQLDIILWETAQHSVIQIIQRSVEMLVNWMLMLSPEVCLSALLWTEILGSYYLLVSSKAIVIDIS